MRPSHLVLSDRRGARLVVFVLVLALAGFFAPVAPRATAAPAQDWLDLSAVADRLQASPDGIPGHFSTVLGGPTAGQQTPVDLPLSVLGIVPDAGLAGALLLVRLDLRDPAMARIGNIASGMSGSPVTIQDAGADKLIGALSYGDAFTTDGLALATPIEDMLSVEGDGLLSGQARALSTTPRPIPPVRVDGRTISKVVVAAPDLSAKDRAKASSSTDSGTAYFTPLLGLQIGGLPARSSAYQRLESRALKRGLQVLAPHGAGAAGRADDFAPPMVPGASAGTFYSLGDLSVGAVGTVTYTTPNGGLVAFGHPLLWQGPTAAFFTSAWIDGVWTSSLASYKLGSPGAVLGTLVQDRAAGVGARLDKAPVSVPVTASATVTTGARVVSRTSRTAVAPGTFATDMRSDLPAFAAIQPLLRAADVSVLPGSAKTTLTVVVSDGTRDHTIRRTNLFDDEYDVLGQPAGEVFEVLESVLANPDGTTPATVKSVDLSTQATSTRARAEIRGIYAPGGLRTGRNTVSVAVKPHGSKTEQRVPVTFTIPTGMPLDGIVTAASGAEVELPSDDSTVAGIVAGLNKSPANSDVVVEFKPEGSEAVGARGIAHTERVIEGDVEAATSTLFVEPSANPIVSGQSVALSGTLNPAGPNATVTVQRRTVGSSTWRTIRAAVPVHVEDDEGTFEVVDRPQLSSFYRVTHAGSAGTILGTSTTVGVVVRGRIAVTGARAKKGYTLTATVTPRVGGATVTFQRLRAGTWQSIKTVKTGPTGQARYAWPVKKGNHQVRAVLKGGPTLAGNVSPTLRLRR